jgi:ankyrin repeat protein
MPLFPPPASASPYAIFEGHPSLAKEHNVLDYDGVPVYESDFGELLLTIIERNDLAMLNQYLTKYPPRNWQTDGSMDDPFLKAAASGSTDALHVLLEHCASREDKSAVVDAQGRFLLWEACENAQVDTVCFLLDNEPLFRHAHSGIGDIHTIGQSGKTALLSAAISFTTWDREIYDIREHLARGEQLMQMLLDRGACAHDGIRWHPDIELDPIVMAGVPREEVFRETVLSLAVSQASPDLIKRLINGGANVHSKTLHSFNQPVHVMGNRQSFQGVTPLHIGSYYLNVEGIQALLDHRGSDIDIVDMVSCRDSHGSLPLHWAAAGPGDSEEYYVLSGRDVALQRISIFKLLLGPDPTSINARDNRGQTALFWATRNRGQSGSRHFDILKFLCDNGADVSVRDRNGQTPLHWLGFPNWTSEPIDTAIIDLFLAHGAKLGDTDLDGNTPLHLAVRCLTQVNAVRFLLYRGADVDAKNSKGNTPLHEVADNPRWVPGRFTSRDDKIRVQDEMIRALQEAAGNTNLMAQPNDAGKTPQQIRDEKWREWDELERERLAESSRREARDKAGMGRGRWRVQTS